MENQAQFSEIIIREKSTRYTTLRRNNPEPRMSEMGHSRWVIRILFWRMEHVRLGSILLKNSEKSVPQKFIQMQLCAKIGAQCHRSAATVVSGCLHLNFRVPPNLFWILKRAALQIFTGRRKHSFSTVSVGSRDSN
jgi:hypothetical protein